MMCIVEILCLVFGIIILAKGRVPFGSKKEVRGGPAYVIGLLLVAVFPLALLIGVIVGVHMAQQGAPLQFDLSLVLIDVGVVAGCCLPALLIALITAKPKLRKRRRTREGDDYDDYDDRHDDDEDVRPRRRLDELEDEESQRPRHDYDDEEPRRRRRRSHDDDDDRPRRDDY